MSTSDELALGVFGGKFLLTMYDLWRIATAKNVDDRKIKRTSYTVTLLQFSE